MSVPRTLLLAILMCPGISTAQKFQTASIKANDDEQGRCAPNRSMTADTLTLQNCSLGAIILFAYDVLQQQVSGDTLHLDDHYDIAAKAAQPVTHREMKRLLQALLEDRFKLTLRRETREIPVYALLVAKDGPKFQPTQPASDDGPKFAGAILQNAAMSDLVFALSRRIPERFVVDKTGLTGKYDLDMSWYVELAKPNPPSVFTAIQVLGLKLEPQQSSVEFLIIDHLAKPRILEN